MTGTDIQRVSVVGAGLLGHGIAQEFAAAGFEVTLNDLSDEILDKAKDSIRANLSTLSRSGLVDALDLEKIPDNIVYTSSLHSAVSQADLVVEAISENLELKQKMFYELDKLTPRHSILASNSSTFMPSSLASHTTRPGNVLVCHYFNPPYLIPLVEIVRHKGTEEEVVDKMHALYRYMGKEPVVVKKEALGFIGNRLQAALFRECLSLVDKGVASAEDVDSVVRNGFGRRLSKEGPFTIADIAGLDVYSALMSYILPDLDNSIVPNRLLSTEVNSGHLGLKTGQGFYEWSPDIVSEVREGLASVLIDIQKREL